MVKIVFSKDNFQIDKENKSHFLLPNKNYHKFEIIFPTMVI